MWPFLRRTKYQRDAHWQRRGPKTLVQFDEDGRRHRTDAPYLLPKDEQEMQRLDYQHFLLRQVLQRNTFAPVEHLLKKGANVLDVGCGTGRWGREMALSYPRTQVIGLDLEHVSRTASMPLNYRVAQGNILHGLSYAAQQFHYVHQRLLVAGIPFEKWPAVVAELRRVTMPKGWVELVEMGTTFHHAGPVTKQCLEWWRAVSATRGIDAARVAHLDALLQQSGFSQVQAETKTVPVGTWGGRLGDLLARDLLAGWPSMRPLVHQHLGVAPTVFDTVIELLEEEWNTRQTRYEVYCACGQV